MVGIHQALLAGYGGSGAAPLPTLSLIYIDGAEHYARNDDKWTGTTNSPAPASGVTGAHGKVNDDSVFTTKRSRTFVTPVSTLTYKARFRFRVLGDEAFIAFRNGTTNHIQVELRSTGVLQVGSPAFTHNTTSTYAIDTWYEIEFTATINNTTGSYKLMVDGVVPSKSGGGTMEQSGLDTQNGATTTVDNINSGGGITIDTYSDDHAIDGAGNEIGLGQVETLYPDGAGDLTEMTPSAGSNFQCVDEATHNSDTDFVSNAASNKRDCYTFQNRSITGTPRAVQVSVTSKLTSGTPTLKPFLRIGGVNYDPSTAQTQTSGYKTYTAIWNTNPATSAAWTDTEINSLQAGPWCIDANIRVTQVVVEVWAAP